MASILLRFFSISGWKAQYAIAQGSSLLLTYDYGQFEINVNFLFVNFCFILFYHAGSVMHYGLGSAMKTKLNTNGAVIGQRKGLSKAGSNECNFQLSTRRHLT
jgi:choriolysin H